MAEPNGTGPATAEENVEKQAPGSSGPMGELGVSGLQQFGGQIHEEFLRQLQGQRGRRVYEEMRSNDPIIGALLFAIEMPIREVEWTVEVDSDDPQAEEAKEFVESCLDDMSLSWSDFISQVLTMLPFGYSVFEKVYKVRRGFEADPSSKHDDGKITWRKFAERAQDTIFRWLYDDDGRSLVGYEQRALPAFTAIDIPMAKSILFRTRNEKNNPEGRSVLRNAYRPWYFKKNLESLEAIALERVGAGFPVVYMPSQATTGSGSNSDETKAKNMVRRIRLDEQFGLTFPGPKGGDGDGTDGWRFELVAPPTGRGVAAGFHEAINRYKTEMLQSVLASFVALGTGNVGSFALSRDQRDFFQIAIEGWVTNIEDTLNRFAIPELMLLNGFDPATAPRLTHTPIGNIDLAKLAGFITAAGGQGFLTPTRDLEEWLRMQAGMPELPEEEEMPAPDLAADEDALRTAEDMLPALRRATNNDPTVMQQAEEVVKNLRRMVQTEQKLAWR